MTSGVRVLVRYLYGSCAAVATELLDTRLVFVLYLLVVNEGDSQRGFA